ALRRHPYDSIEGGLGEDQDLSNGARDRGGRPALFAGLRGPRLGGPAEDARRAAARTPDPRGGTRPASRLTVRRAGQSSRDSHVYSGRAAGPRADAGDAAQEASSMSISRGVEWGVLLGMRKIETVEQMPEEYRQVILKLLSALASTEFASVEQHHPW